jgi:nitrogen fixation/metabolism regulation signal transduction histidine kinase
MSGFVEVSIRDYGVGLSDDQIKCFNEKGKMYSTIGTQGEKGTGYGMMLVKNYMEFFGGNIELDSSDQGLLVKLKLKPA